MMSTTSLVYVHVVGKCILNFKDNCNKKEKLNEFLKPKFE